MSVLVKEINATEYEATIKTDGVVLVDFWAPWCNPCRMLTPVLDSIADEFRDMATVVKVNADTEADLAKSLSIRSIPALFLYKGGEVKQSFSGMTSRDKLKDAIDGLLSASATEAP